MFARIRDTLKDMRAGWKYLERIAQRNSSQEVLDAGYVTPMQARIELSTTNGRLYNGRSSLDRSNSLYAEFLAPEEIRTTEEGLQAALLELETENRLRKGSKEAFTLYSRTGKRLLFKHASRERLTSVMTQNQRAIDRAYNARGRALGGRTFLRDQVMARLSERYILPLVQSGALDSR